MPGSLSDIAARLSILSKATAPLRVAPSREIADALQDLERKRSAISEQRKSIDADIAKGSRVTTRRRPI